MTDSELSESQAPKVRTVVHLLRHGEVENPTGVLYGRLPGFHLSALGRKMAARIAESVADRDITHLVSSPLERGVETAEPIAARLDLEVATDERLIEAENVFQGHRFGVGDGVLRHPQTWWHLRNPFRPSWGEPYRDVIARMMPAIVDARLSAAGHEALLVSHQLPIWITRCHVEGRRLVHDPRKRQCTLASLTSFTFLDDRIFSVGYSQPALDLVPAKDRSVAFSAGA
ncbi:MAG: histidine phosphatase family protein [Nocardioidaceae bacterium]